MPKPAEEILRPAANFNHVYYNEVSGETVSVAVTLRSEYRSVLKGNSGSVAALNQALRDKMSGL